MKTRIAAVLLTFMLFGAASFSQEKQKSPAPVKSEKPCEMSKQSPESCCAGMQAASCGTQVEKKSSDAEKKETKEAAVVYTCPMHPEVQSDKPGKCSKCGMDLVKKK